MRFFADGPSIPDELLWERDEGKVVFFCGAGVSRAYASLPDFFGLANIVAEHLGIGKDSDAYRLIHSAHEIEKNAGISGLISADRIFGLLERDFRAGDIEEAVASALDPEKQYSPKKPNYLEAHQILLDLATGVDGKVRLVTTNFDRLFEQCRKRLKIWQPPKLPDPSRVDEMDGIVYLHGLATKDYQGAEGDGFILSTSQFGKAYLAEGWATQFIRQILDNYTIVFVGYSADDPPVQYLLEALHKMKATHNKIYAFQSDDGEDVINRWKYKGVMPICFPAGGYDILWKTLEAWAKRARNPDKWYEQVIKKFASNPRTLQPFERGQIAHIVSSSEGAKKFAEAKPVPSAEWLCVFDKSCRYSRIPILFSSLLDENFVDPFSLYGLDSDELPRRLFIRDENQKSATPSDAWDASHTFDPIVYSHVPDILSNVWDAFHINQQDLFSLEVANISSFVDNASLLVNRLEQLALWLTEVIDQPAALYWAADQNSLNHLVVDIIRRKLATYPQLMNRLIRQRWRLLLEKWENIYPCRDDELNDLLSKDKNWNTSILKKFEQLTRPHPYVVSSLYLPSNSQKLKINRENINEFAPVDITYPSFEKTFSIPDKWCSAAVKVLRKNMETAISFEKKFRNYNAITLQPIGGEKKHTTNSQRTEGLSHMVIYFSKLFDQLCKIDLSSAKLEFLSWPKNDGIVFAHLRIWAAGKAEIVTDGEFGQFISSLSDRTLWAKQHKQYLLSTLAIRWVNLDSVTRFLIEKRLLENFSYFTGEDQSTRKKRRALQSLTYLYWLKSNGCKLSTATQRKAQKLRSIVPDWSEERARKAGQSTPSDFESTNTDYTTLLNIPISELLPEAKRIQPSLDCFSIFNSPFKGLVGVKPVHAFSALCFEAKKGIFQPWAWAWETFFHSNARKADQNRFKLLIANRLLNYSDEQIAIIIEPVSYWLYNTVKIHENTCIPVFFRLAKKLVEILQTEPDKDLSTIVRNSGKITDWFSEAKFAPSGRITLAILTERFKNNLNDKHFHHDWFGLIESLLKLPDGSRPYVQAILFSDINWFFKTDKNWTQKNLLSILHNSNSIDCDAAWSGFLSSYALQRLDIYNIVKDDLFEFINTNKNINIEDIYTIDHIMLELWDKTNDDMTERCCIDDELHELLTKTDDRFRTGFLELAKDRIRNQNGASDQWKSHLSELIKIWPKQVTAWSTEVSAGFCELLLESGEQFPVLLKLVIDRLNKIIPPYSINFYNLMNSDPDNKIIQDYPKELLELLFTVLPDDARQWPYDMDDIWVKIVEADNSVETDERYIELKRRYSS